VPQTPPSDPSALSRAEARAESRREAAPAALLVPVLFVLLALVSRVEHWQLVGLPWWSWLIIALPGALLTLDFVLAWSGNALARTRGSALVLLGVLVLGNAVGLVVLVAALLTTSTQELSGGELLLTAFAIWSADAIVFGLLFWEVDAGGPVARMLATLRSTTDFRFPQDEDPGETWRPCAWDYLYVSLTNSIAFSPTDTMPMSLRAKALMGAESAISAATVLLVAARAVNVLGS
jgi:uncharacterized membrane protein